MSRGQTTANLIMLSILGLNACSPAMASSGRDTVRELVTLFSTWTGNTDARPILNEIAQHIDYAEMCHLAFAPEQWNSLSPAQRNEAVDAFRQLIETRYYKRWHKLFLTSKLTVANEVKAGVDDYVKTYVGNGKADDADTIIWRLRPDTNNQLSVISLNVNGKDLLQRLSPRLRKQCQRKGAAATIAWLKYKAYADSDPDTASAYNHRETASK